MSFYSNEFGEEMKERGIDWDLWAAFINNPQDGLTLDDIDKVHAVFEGENDGDNWRWIASTKEGELVYLEGGCDYTGWDCRSFLDHEYVENYEEALDSAVSNGTAWWGGEPRVDVAVVLLGQIISGQKHSTWRDETTEVMRELLGKVDQIDG